MHVNGSKLYITTAQAEEKATKLQERVVVGRVVGCRIEEGEDYLIDKVSEMQVGPHYPLKQQDKVGWYLCGKTFKHLHNFRKHRATHLATRQLAAE